ncbi:MAG: flagellar biosynthesis anti-sigma factor FlgM [Planctomycetota bacterium]
MQIYGPYRVSTASPTSSASATRQTSASQQGLPAERGAANRPTAAPVDQLDLSSAARSGGAASVNRVAETQASGSEPIRIDRVAELRREIASGNYDTPEKLDAAFDKMLDAWA